MNKNQAEQRQEKMFSVGGGYQRKKCKKKRSRIAIFPYNFQRFGCRIRKLIYVALVSVTWPSTYKGS